MQAFIKPNVKAIAQHLKISEAYVCMILKGQRSPKKLTKKVFELAGQKRAA